VIISGICYSDRKLTNIEEQQLLSEVKSTLKGDREENDRKGPEIGGDKGRATLFNTSNYLVCET
jgi:hypothetical protein